MKYIFAGDSFFHLPIDVLHIFFFKLSVIGDEVNNNLEACDLCEANDTAQKEPVEFLQDQLADDFLARTIECVVFVNQPNFVLVCSDKFGQNRGSWSWVVRTDDCSYLLV